MAIPLLHFASLGLREDAAYVVNQAGKVNECRRQFQIETTISERPARECIERRLVAGFREGGLARSARDVATAMGPSKHSRFCPGRGNTGGFNGQIAQTTSRLAVSSSRCVHQDHVGGRRLRPDRPELGGVFQSYTYVEVVFPDLLYGGIRLQCGHRFVFVESNVH